MIIIIRLMSVDRTCRSILQLIVPDVKNAYCQTSMIAFSRQSRSMNTQWFFIMIGFYT